MLDSQPINITCPNCSKTIWKTIGLIKKNKQFRCDCGKTLSLDGTELFEKIKECEVSLKKLREQFGDRIKF